MKMMARICFYADGVELGIAALRAHGFEILTHIFPDEPDHVFAEATRDVSNEGDEYKLSCDFLDEVSDIVGQDGFVDNAGPIPADPMDTASTRALCTGAQRSPATLGSARGAAGFPPGA